MAILRQVKGDLTAAWNGTGLEPTGTCVTIPVSDAGSVMVSVAGTPAPNLTLQFEGYDGNTWGPVNAWDPATSAPSLLSSVGALSGLLRVANAVGYSQFRVRASTFTAAASIIITADSDVISVPPMLGATQGVVPKDASGAASTSIVSCAISAAGENATMIGSATTRYLHSYHICNTGAAMAFVKLYATATTPTSGSTPQLVIGVPAGGHVDWSAGGGFGMRFNNGLGIRTTTGIANGDAVGVALNQLAITIGYN